MSDDYLPPLPPPERLPDPEPITELYERWPRPEMDPEDVARFQNWLALVKEKLPPPLTLPLSLPGSTVSHKYGREQP